MVKKREEIEKKDLSLNKRFKEYLKNEGLSYTSQRGDIVDFIVKKKLHHFSAEELIEELKRNGVRVSRATVYRTINHLTQAGFLREVALSNTQMYYDFIPQQKHHEHLVCEKCNRIVEFTDPNLEEAIERVAKDAKYLITKHTVQIFGICEVCNNKENEKNKENFK